MKLLTRNMQDLWYANPTGTEYVVDDNNLKTGDRKTTYGEPVKKRMSVTRNSARGDAWLRANGIVTEYTHTALTCDKQCGMTEESIVWYGIEPTKTVTEEKTIDGHTVTVRTKVPVPHNYVVTGKNPSLNCLMYYLKEVHKS